MEGLPPPQQGTCSADLCFFLSRDQSVVKVLPQQGAVLRQLLFLVATVRARV